MEVAMVHVSRDFDLKGDVVVDEVWIDQQDRHCIGHSSVLCSTSQQEAYTVYCYYMSMSILRYIALSSPTSYSQAATLQQTLVSAFLAHKAAPLTTHQHQPTVLTAQFHPVYTCGRREVGTVTPSQREYLTAPFTGGQRAEFVEALRGGQTTFHGPGQLVAYPILDLKKHGLSPRCYVRLLEDTVIQVMKNYGVKGITTENPGVWTTDGERKVCAVGVHLRRNITSHGIGLNVTGEPLGWLGRIVGCGLEGKGPGSLITEGAAKEGLNVETVGKDFVRVLGESLGVDGVMTVDEADLSLG